MIELPFYSEIELNLHDCTILLISPQSPDKVTHLCPLFYRLITLLICIKKSSTANPTQNKILRVRWSNILLIWDWRQLEAKQRNREKSEFCYFRVLVTAVISSTCQTQSLKSFSKHKVLFWVSAVWFVLVETYLCSPIKVGKDMLSTGSGMNSFV